MLYDKVNPSVILAYIVKSGYGGNLNTLQTYIELLAKNNFKLRFPLNWAYKFDYPDDIVIVKRNEILKYITTKNSKRIKNETIGKYLDIIKGKYEIVTELEISYDEFYNTLMSNVPNQLEYFIEKYDSSAIKGFVEGIKKDITPVKNAISHSVSSGFVEGNNKFKLIKRIIGQSRSGQSV